MLVFLRFCHDVRWPSDNCIFRGSVQVEDTNSHHWANEEAHSWHLPLWLAVWESCCRCKRRLTCGGQSWESSRGGRHPLRGFLIGRVRLCSPRTTEEHFFLSGPPLKNFTCLFIVFVVELATVPGIHGFCGHPLLSPLLSKMRSLAEDRRVPRTEHMSLNRAFVKGAHSHLLRPIFLATR